MARKIIYLLLINAIALGLANAIVVGFDIEWSVLNYLYLSAAFTLLNYIIKPILKILTSPIIILTFGIGLIVINAILVYLLTILFPNIIQISGLHPLVYATLVIGISNAILHLFLRTK